MKSKFLAVSTALVILLISCTKENTTQENFQQKTNSYNEKFQFSKKNQNTYAKIDKQKALKLALVDAGAGVGVGPVWGVPVIGIYAGLWLSFGASWAAAGRNQNTPCVQNVDLSIIDNVINTNSTVPNPFFELGQKHNSALNDLASSEISMLDNDKLTAISESYMVNNSFMNTTLNDRLAFISDPSNREIVENNYKTYSLVETIQDIDKLVSSNPNSSSDVKNFVLSINDFLESNETSISGKELTVYIDGLENLIVKDDALSNYDKEILMKYLSVLNYSYCFWEIQ